MLFVSTGETQYARNFPVEKLLYNINWATDRGLHTQVTVQCWSDMAVCQDGKEETVLITHHREFSFQQKKGKRISLSSHADSEVGHF